MTLERRIAALFRMDERTWLRHANPWSVWTRLTALPLLLLALWSHAWLGWGALLPVTAALAWIWLNPRIFPPATSVDNWASQGVLGERVWLDRDHCPVPAHHRRVPHLLSALAAAGALVALVGVATLCLTATVLGAVVAILAKLWFVDRMVWLYRDMTPPAEEADRL